MKSIFLFLLLNISLSCWAIDVFKTPHPEKWSCKATYKRSVYIKEQFQGRFLYEEISTPEIEAISKKRSSVQIWEAEPGLIQNCADTGSWRRLSSITAPDSRPVVAIGANCLFNKPKTSQQPQVKIFYEIVTAEISHKNGELFPYSGDLAYYLGSDAVRNGDKKTIRYDGIGFTNYRVKAQDCVEYELQYCGDGVIQQDYEVCDDGNQKDGDGCSSKCR